LFKSGAVLFNTLAYAKFFAVVFVVAWVLVHRRWAPLLPWFALGAYALAVPSPTAVVLGAVAFALTLSLCRAPEPSRRTALASVLVNLVALGFLTHRATGLDPVSLGLQTLGLPVARLGVGTWAVGALGALGLAALVQARKIRLLFLLGASYVFYAHWDWRFLPLIWGSSTADWLLGHAIARAKDPRRKKLWLVATVIMNLGVLGFFKYFNFGIDSMAAALGAFGIQAPEVALRVALPVGISFFTFESMSYVIDVYRGELEPQKSYFEYLSFVAFFPHLVAGPIVRPRDLLPQLAGPARWSSAEASEGLFLIATGLLKKVVIGDFLALNLVDRVFDAPLMYSALECYAAVVGYALQIYCDFSGYTDIAIGSALLLGVRFPLNFNAPYKAHNIVDFWRRWHISLSTWLRDYLYISLGGNRRGKARTYLNLLLTMLLGGLWHGASWTFVVWGGLHGAALAVTKAFQDLRARRARSATPSAEPPSSAAPSVSAPSAEPPSALPSRAQAPADVREGSHGAPPSLPRPPSPWGRVVGVVATFHFVCACWVFFRAESFAKAHLIFSQMGTLTTYHPNLHTPVLVVLGLGLATHLVPERLYLGARETFVRLPAPVQGLALFLAAIALRQMASSSAVPFVYFQF
jgi:D-alanyl-lipoteichoic acid acyltransferase DltB (MBOAT superfamily)